MLVFSHDEVVHGKGSMIGKMPGATLETKAENLRTAYAFMMGHPGKKLLFMGQEYAQVSEWNEGASLEWGLLEQPVHKNMQDYVRTLNKLYLEHPALYEMDYDPEGFEWINCSYQNESMVMFIRRSKKAGETLLFICNFDNIEHEKFRVGVPFEGKYKEIFNTDAKEFGGSGRVNGRMKSSKKIEWDEKEDSIEVNIPPMSVSIFTCTPEPKAKKAGAGKAAAGKGQAAKAVKKAGVRTEVKAGPGKKAKVEAEPEKKVEVEAEPEKKAETEAEPEKKTEKKPAPKRLSTKKEDQKKLTTAKEVQKQISTAKKDQKQISTTKKDQKQISTTKADQKQISTTKADQKQISTAKTDQKKLSTARKEPGRLSTKKEGTKQITTKKTEPKQISTSKTGQKRLGASKAGSPKTEDNR